MRFIDTISRVAHDQRAVHVERASKMGGDDVSIDTVFRLVPEGSRDLLAYERFQQLVAEHRRRDHRAAA